MQTSLPLFDDPSPPPVAVDPPTSGRRRSSDPHLSAARRLAREIRRTQRGSPEQTLTGRRICRHLLAMLQQSNPAEQTLRVARPVEPTC